MNLKIGYESIITHVSQVGGYPEYKGTPYLDADADGIPDAWEKKFGLNDQKTDSSRRTSPFHI